MIAQGSGDEEVMLDLVAKCAVAMFAAANDEIKSSKKVITTELQSVAERMRTQSRAAFRVGTVLWGEICMVAFHSIYTPKVQNEGSALIRWTNQISSITVRLTSSRDR
jgi:hypothetical protein